METAVAPCIADAFSDRLSTNGADGFSACRHGSMQRNGPAPAERRLCAFGRGGVGGPRPAGTMG